MSILKLLLSSVLRVVGGFALWLFCVCLCVCRVFMLRTTLCNETEPLRESPGASEAQ